MEDLKTFISYSRSSRPAADKLASDLDELHCDVWYDVKLEGAQAWWNEIIRQIQDCDVFIFAATPESIKSQACQTELSYAMACGKQILPIRLSDEVSAESLPHSIQGIQCVDYYLRTADDYKALKRTLDRLSPALPRAGSWPRPPSIPEQSEPECIEIRDGKQFCLDPGEHEIKVLDAQITGRDGDNFYKFIISNKRLVFYPLGATLAKWMLLSMFNARVPTIEIKLADIKSVEQSTTLMFWPTIQITTNEDQKYTVLAGNRIQLLNLWKNFETDEVIKLIRSLL